MNEMTCEGAALEILSRVMCRSAGVQECKGVGVQGCRSAGAQTSDACCGW
jgi:hypothetical protein